MTRAVVLALLAAAVLLLATTGCSTGKDAVAQGDTFQFVSPGGKTVIDYAAADRKTIAPLSGRDLVTDKKISLTDFAGKVVVINVWGSWCGPCRGEADGLQRVYSQTKDSGVAFLGINFRDDRSSAQDFVTDRHITYPSIFDYGGATLASLTTPTSVVPTTIVLDRKHRPAVVYLTSISGEELRATVNRLVAEPVSQ
ncbi:TlpA family protein disulfide reductase [Gordonia sp. TBRC 11910]|uniref:TlpA family protein disulfide reductase n=1 Tax=Gordonia asplenii TaxID=2725283 RepID=A0A848L5J5_9ACTN|nr:TlpA disulfide reductase family protein [Gordonia asplenii]NMO03913.1 TlpA family protein disulfide reductase [Gordonia asplenii]